MTRIVLPGKPYPLGAHWDGKGVNFAIFSEHASQVELCLFLEGKSHNGEEKIALQEVTAHVWHGYLPGVKPGQLYGYRVHGPYQPQEGLRFNPAKLLIDLYAKAIAGKVNWEAPVFGYSLERAEADLAQCSADDAWGVPKGVVIDPAFDWEDDQPPQTPLYRSILYETHVKGLTARHPQVPPELRGTYAGLATRPVLEYFKNLGITAVELLPVHAFVDDKPLVERGLTNYWGYNTLNFFSPMARYASRGDRGGQVEEFKAMVKALPREGIEVILDVVYNHSCEGNHLGPTLSFRGIDNPVYYRLTPEKKRYYVDRTGIGNTLNTGHPQVLQLLMDSLRYWVLEMHVDGFRFDLAAALATELQEANRLAGFFDVIHQDPVISQVKLIAEPWSLGEGGYQIGNFPILWAEWNGKFRDTARSYWRGDGHQLAELGYRLTGSSDLYHHDGRRPFASINFVTAHDGFTLHDLVSYDHKHNAANGEDNQDGSDDNRSANYGVEGPTEDSSILALRERQQRNLLASLLLASGVPMLCGGDEPDRTQQGNNNAYCQDNELSWYDWELDERRQTLLEFTRHLIRLRQQHPNLHRRRFFQGRRIRGSDIKDLTWLRPDGTEMTDQGWEAVAVHCLGLRLAGESVDEVDENGRPVTNDTLLILLNPTPQAVGFTLPPCPSEGRWWVALNTDTPTLMPDQQSLEGSERLELAARSLVLLRQPGR